MPSSASQRIAAAIAALPIRAGMRVLEIGCGPGAAALEIVRLHPDVFVLGIDRSEAAVSQVIAASSHDLAQGRIAFRAVAAEEFYLDAGEPAFDRAFALRVGALDGRHPDAGIKALPRIAASLSKRGKLFIDGGDPLRQLQLPAV